jgi:hypothetical protein
VNRNDSQANDDDRRVIPFRTPSTNGRYGWRRPPRPTKPAASPIQGFGKYEGADREDSYRHRMAVNFAALAFTVVLSMTGIWLVMQIADMRKNQDCVLSGKRNCAQIEVITLSR